MASSQAVQARLFGLYDEVSDVPEALKLVQRELKLTLDRTWFSEQELDSLADELDRLLELGSAEPEIEEPGGSDRQGQLLDPSRLETATGIAGG